MNAKSFSLLMLVGLSLVVPMFGQAQPWSVAPTNRTPQVRPPESWVSTIPTNPPAPVVQPVPANHPQPANPVMSGVSLPVGTLAFDAEQKECTSQPGDQACHFIFSVTNLSSSDVTVTFVQTSCGCTTANIKLPMKLAPNEVGEIPINMNLVGKSGVVIKTVTVHTDKGQKVLLVKSIIAPPPADPASQEMNRQRNQQLALADRQAVFRGDCAKCHVEPLIGKSGKELFKVACGICHQAEHRATMVPDLHALKVTPTADYWRFFVVNGKPATLMPAFAQAQGGPLSDAQVESLVEYLVKEFPQDKPAAPAVPVPAAH